MPLMSLLMLLGVDLDSGHIKQKFHCDNGRICSASQNCPHFGLYPFCVPESGNIFFTHRIGETVHAFNRLLLHL